MNDNEIDDDEVVYLTLKEEAQMEREVAEELGR